jgi:peptidyl-Asp metalloendopeptidase
MMYIFYFLAIQRSRATILFIVSALVITSNVVGQTRPFVQEPLRIRDDVAKKLTARSINGKLSVFKLNENFRDSASLTIEIDSVSYEFLFDELDKRRDSDFSWFGRTKDHNSSIALTFLDGQVLGSVLILGRHFQISPNGVGSVYFYEQSPTDKPRDHDEIAAPIIDIPVPKNGNLRTNLTDGIRRIRVLLAYTDAAETGLNSIGITDMRLFLQNAITTTNQTFINSNVVHRVRLACGIRTFYNPSAEADGHDDAANRLKILNDGYMDEIITYRDNTSADVCVVIINNASLCGSAVQIGSNSANAYASVHWECINTNNTLAHEIGHLHGCRHNPEADGANVPFAYGHGFLNETDGWRTVMSYDCEDGPCATRIANWSNPDVLIGGVATGTAGTHDNARVLDETSAAIAAYRTAPATVSLGLSSSLVYRSYAEVIATSEVVMANDFFVELGCEYHVYVDPLAAATDYFPFRTAAETTETDITREEKLNEPFTIFPNPSNGEINISSSVKGSYDIIVTDLSGKLIFQVQQINEPKIKLNLNRQPPGLLNVIITTPTRKYTKNILKF